MNKGDNVSYTIERTSIIFFIYKRKKQIQLGDTHYYYNRNNKKKEKHEIVSYYNLTKGGLDTVDAAAGVFQQKVRLTNGGVQSLFIRCLYP